jgi:hypothetical protein
MPFALFRDYFPEIAERETRSATVLGESQGGLPRGHYAFLEMFCNEPGCDCRRVFFYVVSDRANNLEAVVAYGWETPDFYAKWLHDGDPNIVRELIGPSLNIGSPQSEIAPAILELVREILKDKEYVKRIERHYRMVRQAVDGKKPALAKKKKRKARNPVRGI